MDMAKFEQMVSEAVRSVVETFDRQQLINFVTADLVDASAEWKASHQSAEPELVAA